MLRKFRVKNFLSFRNWQTLDLTVAANAPDMPGRFVQSIPGSKDRFPTFVAIFGANASGKTNILRALTFLTGFVRYSQIYPPNAPIPSIPCFGIGRSGTASEFEVEFDADYGNSKRRMRFLYQLSISSDQERVLEENLNYYPGKKSRRLFSRQSQEFKFGNDYHINRNDPSIAKIRTNSSVISTLAQFNHAFSIEISERFFGLQSNVAAVLGNQEISIDIASKYYNENPDILNKSIDFLKRFDFGLTDIKIMTSGEIFRPLFFHHGIRRALFEEYESHGTNKIFALFPTLIHALENGGIAVIDELDNAIHSLLLPEIIDLFADPVRNPNGAQLIAACHNPSLLQYLEKEEVFFTEKGADGATDIYGLKDIKGVRRENNIYANYLAGAFGGVPKVA